MALVIEVSDQDRWHVMHVLYSEGKTFPEMLPILQEHGLLECRNEHRKRRGRFGEDVCATCEDTISQQWRRGLARLSAVEAKADEVLGEWLEAHRFIAQTCRQNAIKRDKVTTISGEGEATVTTITETVRVDRGLLRLLSETLDKITRVTGVDIEDPEAMSPVPRSKVRVNRSGDGTGSGERAVN